MQGGAAAGAPAPGAEGVPCQHALAAAAVQAAVGKGHLSHRRVGGCVHQALQWGGRRGAVSQTRPQHLQQVWTPALRGSPALGSESQLPAQRGPGKEGERDPQTTSRSLPLATPPLAPTPQRPCPAPAWSWSSSSCRTGCPAGKRWISSMMCTLWFTCTALCKRPSSANTRAVLSGAEDTQCPSHPIPSSPQLHPPVPRKRTS